MKKVLILKGLPASGKSTYALQLLKDHPGMYKRINKDELRAMLDGGKWSEENEKFVLSLRDDLIRRILLERKSGIGVIVDDTNLHPKHEAQIRDLVEKVNRQIRLMFLNTPAPFPDNIEVEVKTFDTDVTECIKRDSERANSVGAKVIREMYNKFVRKEPEKIAYNPSFPDAIICDMDGTLALHNGRNPYETEKCGDDLVNTPVADVVQKYGDLGGIMGGVQYERRIRIFIVSGRDDTYYGYTTQWLDRNGIPFDEVYMRKANDRRDDAIVKKELYEAHIKGKYNVLFVLDDRRRVVDMWREQGLTVLQVAPGEF